MTPCGASTYGSLPSITAPSATATAGAADGQRAHPYHFHHGIEEWLLVVAGTPRLWTPDGERVGVRIVMLSTIPETRIAGSGDPISITVYPDSDKVSVWPPGKRFRMSDSVGYWDGEL